jgi:hypothetical protein
MQVVKRQVIAGSGRESTLPTPQVSGCGGDKQ